MQCVILEQKRPLMETLIKDNRLVPSAVPKSGVFTFDNCTTLAYKILPQGNLSEEYMGTLYLFYL